MKVEWAPLAIDRVAEMAAHIAEDNPIAAEQWVRNIFARAGQLRQFPRRGRAMPETTRKDIRALIGGNHRIIYRLTTRRAAILTVRHTKTILPLAELD